VAALTLTVRRAKKKLGQHFDGEGAGDSLLTAAAVQRRGMGNGGLFRANPPVLKHLSTLQGNQLKLKLRATKQS